MYCHSTLFSPQLHIDLRYAETARSEQVFLLTLVRSWLRERDITEKIASLLRTPPPHLLSFAFSICSSHLLTITTSTIHNNGKRCHFSSTQAILLLRHPLHAGKQTRWLNNCHQIHRPTHFHVGGSRFIAAAPLLGLPCPSRPPSLSLPWKAPIVPSLLAAFSVTLGRHCLPPAPEMGSNQPPSQVLIWCNGPLITVYPFNESAQC